MAKWVYKLGQWIDNHMPRNTDDPYGYNHDWYHPTIDLAITSASCSADHFRLGYWDDFGGIAELQVFVNNIEIATLTNRRNGSIEGPLAGLIPNDTITVVAKDFSDNRQIYEKSVSQLINECQGPAVQPTPTKKQATQILRNTR